MECERNLWAEMLQSERDNLLAKQLAMNDYDESASFEKAIQESVQADKKYRKKMEEEKCQKLRNDIHYFPYCTLTFNQAMYALKHYFFTVDVVNIYDKSTRRYLINGQLYTYKRISIEDLMCGTYSNLYYLRSAIFSNSKPVDIIPLYKFVDCGNTNLVGKIMYECLLKKITNTDNIIIEIGEYNLKTIAKLNHQFYKMIKLINYILLLRYHCKIEKMLYRDLRQLIWKYSF